MTKTNNIDDMAAIIKALMQTGDIYGAWYIQALDDLTPAIGPMDIIDVDDCSIALALKDGNKGKQTPFADRYVIDYPCIADINTRLSRNIASMPCLAITVIVDNDTGSIDG